MATDIHSARWQRMRRSWQRVIDREGYVICARCGRPIYSGEPWSLGHAIGRPRALGQADDVDLAPEHRRCSDVSGGRLGSYLRRARARQAKKTPPPAKPSREW